MSQTQKRLGIISFRLLKPEDYEKVNKLAEKDGQSPAQFTKSLVYRELTKNN